MPIKQQSDGHLDQFRVAIYYLSGSVGIPHFSQSGQQKMQEH